MKHQPWLTTSPLVLLLSILLLCACWGITTITLPEQTPTPTPTEIMTDAPPSPTPTDEPTATPTITVTPSATETDTLTPTALPSYTPTTTPTVAPTITHTPDDPTPTRETGYVTPTPERFTLTAPTYLYACADVKCTRYLFPAGTVYEVWDEGTNEGWVGIAIAITDYLYTAFWMRTVTDSK